MENGKAINIACYIALKETHGSRSFGFSRHFMVWKVDFDWVLEQLLYMFLLFPRDEIISLSVSLSKIICF